MNLPGYDAWRTGLTGTQYSDEAIERFQERVDALVSKWESDPAKCAEADEWVDGTMDGAHYSAVERALADLDGWAPERLMGSPAMARILELAKVQADARRARLRIMAETYLCDLDEQRRAA